MLRTDHTALAPEAFQGPVGGGTPPMLPNGVLPLGMGRIHAPNSLRFLLPTSVTLVIRTGRCVVFRKYVSPDVMGSGCRLAMQYDAGPARKSLKAELIGETPHPATNSAVAVEAVIAAEAILRLRNKCICVWTARGGADSTKLPR